MNIPKKEDRVQVQCYKHDSSFHRSWEKLDIIYADEKTIIGVNNSTKVYESNGYFWKTKEPAVSYFRTDKWFNIICMIREDGIYYYCNLSSPIVYDIKTLKYIDYDLDIKVYPDGSYDIVDQNEYAYHKKKMQYPSDIGWILTHQIQELESWIQNKLGPFDNRNVHRWYKEYTKLHMSSNDRLESHVKVKTPKQKHTPKQHAKRNTR